MPPSFVIFALPRSRTMWLSKFLTYGPWICAHDELRHCRSLEDVKTWFVQPCVGSVETIAAPFWRLLRTMQPGARIAVVRRPIPEVLVSLRETGLCFEDAVMARHLARLDAKLVQIVHRLPDVFSVNCADLAEEGCCARLFEHCLGLPHDQDWWAAISPMNIQTNLMHDLRYFAAYYPQLEKLALVAKHRMLADMAPRRDAEFDGMSIGQEPFSSFITDAPDILAQHMVRVGWTPDAWQRTNLPLLQRLDEMGLLQVTTARCNGRLFGYLLAVIAPALEARDWMLAANNAFYASPDVPGLGMRMQRSSLAGLKARGVKEVHMTAGTRGDGARLGTMYRRLGAEHDGQCYRLQLQEGRERWA